MEILDATNTPTIRPRIAELIYNEVSDKTFHLFCEACTRQSDLTFQKYLDAITSEFEGLSSRQEDAGHLLPHIRLTRKMYSESVDNGEKHAHKNFLPEPDRLKDKDITLLPHIYALNNLCGRAEKYRTESGFMPLTFIHDVQREYSLALQDNFEAFKRMPAFPPELRRVAPRLQLDFSEESIFKFEDSKNEPMIQVADVIAGTIGRFLKQWQANEVIRDEYWQVLALLFDQSHGSAGINFVMPHSSVATLQCFVDEL